MIFWGTAIGAERQGGLIRWDYDIDVLVLVDSKATFEYKIWPTFALHMQSLGYRTYIPDSGSHYKIAPGVCRPQTAGDEWRDYLWRFTDDKRRKGIRMSRSQLVAQASEQRRATGPIKNPLGHDSPKTATVFECDANGGKRGSSDHEENGKEWSSDHGLP